MLPTCRICMTSAGVLVDIFATESERSPSLEQMLNQCVDVKVERKDKYPKQLCEICMSDVYSAYRFKQNFEQTLQQLNKKTNTGKRKRDEIHDVSDQKNNSENERKRKRVPALKIRRTVLLTKAKNKKPKKGKGTNQEKQKKKNQDIKVTTDGSESSNNELEVVLEVVQEDRVPIESPAVEEEPITKNKSYICETCNKGFFNKTKLELHMAVHSDQRPFQCEQCLKCFKYKSNLKRHQKQNCK